MGIFSGLFAIRAESVNLAHPKDPALLTLFGAGQDTAAGLSINERTALNFSAYFAGVRLIAESVASLPLITYQRTRTNGQDGKERAMGHPVYRLLHDEPHIDCTAMSWREAMQAHVLTYGNGYSRILRQGSTPIGLQILLPDTVRVWRRDNGIIAYTVTPADMAAYTVDQSDVVHIHGLSYDGLIGYSPVALARESIALGLAAERYGGNFFGSNGVPSGILEHPGRLSDQAYQRLNDAWSARHGRGRGKMQILEEGMKYAKIGLPPEDSQFLQTREFQVQEIARWLNIPPHKLGDLSRSTYSNIEQENLNFLQDTLRPWLRRWEQELNRKLFTGSDRDQVFAEHLVLDLLAVDAKSRGDFYAQMLTNGVMSVNEVRQRENLNAIGDAGDQHFMPVNLTNLEMMMPGMEPMMENEEGDEEETDAEAETEAEGEMMRDAVRDLIRQAVGSVAAGQAKDAIRAAKKPDKFCAWVDADASRVQPVLAGKLRPIMRLIGRDDADAVAAAWCGQAKRGLLEVAGASFPSTIEANVTEYSKRMHGQSEAFADTIQEACHA